jgi:hypothetical protein
VDTADDRGATQVGLAIASLVMSFFFGGGLELFQLWKQGRAGYFGERMNLVDLSTVIMSAFALIWWLHGASNDELQPTMDVAPCLIYMRSLSYLRAFRNTGDLVALILQVMSDMASFVVILITTTTAFSRSFKHLRSFPSSADPLFGTFTVMLGKQAL